ncbi:potassium channel family protein [Rhodococcus qingshengii]|jgi:voltage-gated potassium channel|uniref:Potassium channel family protein n=1 Tax=Rhodococcus qingshengii JCM 15477 TaxID=1303681 RepID=A0AB38RA67_RHOSG|nr:MULTISPECIES: potassium channel family protein [Rhodococcus]NHE65844.1 potassium channel family protein [Rhodococcus sp. D-46]OCC20205.1 ion transporter [Prescottella equi]EME19983.1 ion transport protein [Rhodococcus qingshengii BKS 20-40]MBW0283586.1 ion transporter [Rhodococcus sp. FH8]MBW0293553.1 ion transporter [Rhodococcus sp. MH15]
MNESTKSAHRRTAWTSEKWQLATDIPLTAAACLFLVAYAYQVLAQPTGLPHRLTEWTMWAAWVVFAVDYAVRLWLAPARGRWFVRHLLDLAMVVLPMLRPLRLLRLVTLLAIVHRSSGQSLRGRVVIYATGATALLIGVAALAMLDAERHAQGAAITSYGTALWWAMETVTTVGYGDMAPVTTTGRMIAGALMIGGIALLGIVTATLASWLVERVAEQDEASQAATRKQVADLSEEVRALATRTHRVDLASVDTDSLRRELASRGVVAQHAPSDN